MTGGGSSRAPRKCAQTSESPARIWPWVSSIAGPPMLFRGEGGGEGACMSLATKWKRHEGGAAMLFWANGEQGGGRRDRFAAPPGAGVEGGQVERCAQEVGRGSPRRVTPLSIGRAACGDRLYLWGRGEGGGRYLGSAGWYIAGRVLQGGSTRARLLVFTVP